MKSKNITVTDSRLLKALNIANTVGAKNAASNGSEKQDIKIVTGTLKRLYYEQQEAEVVTSDGSKKCYLLKPFMGGAEVYYTPFGDLKWDKEKRRTYFTFEQKVNCLVLTVDDSSYILGYFLKNPSYVPAIADGGVLRFESYGDSIQLGGNSGGIYFNTPKLVFKDWTEPEQHNKIETSDLNEDNLTNKDYYTKEEVDELLNELKEELLKENNEE